MDGPLAFWYKEGQSENMLWRVKEVGSTANEFLTRALVNSDTGKSHVCQVLILRGVVQHLKKLFLYSQLCQLICYIIWVAIDSSEGGTGKWVLCYTLQGNL